MKKALALALALASCAPRLTYRVGEGPCCDPDYDAGCAEFVAQFDREVGHDVEVICE